MICRWCTEGDHQGQHGIKGPCATALGPPIPPRIDWERCACPWRPDVIVVNGMRIVQRSDVPLGMIYSIDPDYWLVADESGDWRHVLDADERW